jgi:hypothetical protein
LLQNILANRSASSILLPESGQKAYKKWLSIIITLDRYSSTLSVTERFQGFDVKIYDVDNDGVDEIVTSNHKGDGNGGVYTYEVPPTWKNGNWVRHTLAEG